MILMFALILSTCYGANSGQGRLIKKAQNEEKYYNASQYFGVYPSSRGENLWAAGFTIDGKHEFLGNFTTEEKAAQRVKETIKKMQEKIGKDVLKSLGLEHKIKDFTELEIDDVQYIAVSDFPNFTDGELIEWFTFDESDLEKWRKRYPDPENQPIVQEQYNTDPIDAEEIELEITRDDSEEDNLEECDPDSVYGAGTYEQKSQSLKDCAKLRQWYSNPDIKYKKYMKNIEKFDWERFLRTERDYPSIKKSKDKLEISLAALKTFMEYKFLREDLTVGYNKVLFGSKELEDEFLADMKKIQPLQIYGKDLKGQPVVYADVTNGPNEWKALKNLVEETTENEPELGLKKLVYYKYVKVLRFIKNSRYLLVADATTADDNTRLLWDRKSTVETLKKANKYELDMKMAYHNTNDDHLRYGVIVFTKSGLPSFLDWYGMGLLKKRVEAMAYDTYIHPEKKIQETLQNFIAKNQIPKNYISEGKENIVWDSSEPQNFSEMNL